MVRQCAWCHRLIDTHGERVSLLPMHKIQNATHGICQTCGNCWMKQASEEEWRSLLSVFPAKFDRRM